MAAADSLWAHLQDSFPTDQPHFRQVWSQSRCVMLAVFKLSHVTKDAQESVPPIFTRLKKLFEPVSKTRG